jgi:hypothetical protein
MKELSAIIQFEPLPELAALTYAHVGGCGGPPWTEPPFGAAAEWIQAVERSRQFRIPLEGYEPIDGFFALGAL